MLILTAKRAILGAVAALAIVPGAGLAQGDPDSLFRQGNTAFRAGDHDKALSKYRAARASGMDSALLYYNTGVAHYRTGNYLQAEISLRKATRSPKLAAVSYYNLGLTSKAMGDTERARRWFERAWGASERQPKVRELSTKALARMNRRTGDAAIVRAPSGDEALFRFTAVARVGYDDNVYRSPSTSYVDLSDPAQPVVDPMVQSGVFLPINLKAEYAFDADSRTQLSFAYLFDGDYYPDSTLENANEFSQRLRFKGRTLLGAPRGRRWKAFSTKFEMRRQDDTNFDPDDGIQRDVDGEDLSDRFSYTSAALDTIFEHRLGKVGWGLLAGAELRDYESVENVSAYDHKFFLGGTFVRFPVLPRTIMKLGYDYYIRDYAERLTRDLNGNLVVGNPELEYRYQSMEATLTHRMSRMFSVLLSYRYLRRDESTDAFQTPERLYLAVQSADRLLDLPGRMVHINRAVQCKTIATGQTL